MPEDEFHCLIVRDLVLASLIVDQEIEQGVRDIDSSVFNYNTLEVASRTISGFMAIGTAYSATTGTLQSDFSKSVITFGSTLALLLQSAATAFKNNAVQEMENKTTSIVKAISYYFNDSCDNYELSEQDRGELQAELIGPVSEGLNNAVERRLKSGFPYTIPTLFYGFKSSIVERLTKVHGWKTGGQLLLDRNIQEEAANRARETTTHRGMRRG
jgi:hypothetical protein